MKKKPFIIALVVLGVIILAVGGYFVYRYVTEQPVATVEQTENLDASQLIDEMQAQETDTNKEKSNKPMPAETKQGTFQDADAIHSGSGTAVITQTDNGPVLVFKDDFSVTNGPDLFVYLSPNTDARPLGEFVSLGRLKSTSGAQAYNLPANYQEFSSVTIWCRAFSTQFSYANLQ